MATYTCCTGQTECNHIITIGYLKSFIGTDIKNAGGVTVYVNTTQPDSYVPTYSELTSGTLIPQFVDGGNGRWHSSIDGITVKGTYASNQNVKQEDLVLTYTRINSFSVSAGKTSFSECADSTNVCATYTLTKTIKQMNSSCTVTSTTSTNSDTTCKMSFSTNCNWLSLSTCSSNCVTASAEKNGTWSSSQRSCTVTASLTYKGTNYSDSVTITQRPLTGSYSVYEGRHYTGTVITDHDALTQNTCTGATVTASATAYYYDRYKWKDSCNEVYEYNYDDRYGSEAAGSDSYTFAPVYCPTESQTDSYTMTIIYQGHSDSITFYQVCYQECETCEDYITYGSCNGTASVGECGGEVTVSCEMPATIHHKAWNATGQCVETGTTPTSYTQSIRVIIPENTTQLPQTHPGSEKTEEGGTINYTITQSAGPCGGCGEENSAFTYSDVTVNCSAHTNEEISVPYTCVITPSVAACSSTTVTGVSGYTINIPCNTESTIRDYSQGDWTIHQAAGPCCPTGDTFVYSNLTIPCTGTPATSMSANYTQYHLNPDGTTSVITSANSVSVSAQACNPDSNTKTIQTGHSGATLGEATPTIIQEAGPCCCNCDNLIVCDSYEVGSTGALNVQVGYFNADTCVTGLTVTSSENWLRGLSANANGTITGSYDDNPSPNPERTTTVTVTGSDGTRTCTKQYTLKQFATTCETDSCTCYVVSNATGSANSTATSTSVTWSYTAITWTTASTCVVSSSKTEGTSSTTVTFAAATCNDYTKNGSFVWTGHKACITSGCGSNDITVNWSVAQQRPADCDCDCSALTFSEESLYWTWDLTTPKTVTATSSPSNCVTNMTFGNLNNFTVEGEDDKIIITPNGRNTTNSAITEILTVSFTSGTHTDCTKVINLSQAAPPCQSASCICYAITNSSTSSTESITCDSTSVTLSWNYEERRITSGYDCSVSSQVINTGSESVRVTFSPNTNGTSSVTRNGSYTWNGHNKCGNNSCTSETITIPWSVTLPPCGCDCSDIRLTKES